MRKTKIVCTLGPATDREGVLREMLLAGMNVARFNFSHGSHEEHKQRLDQLKALREELDLPVAAMLDTKGPEIRLRSFRNGSVMLKTGQDFTLTTEDVPGDETRCAVTYAELPQDVKAGNTILLDDGLVRLTVLETTASTVHCRVENDGIMKNNKGVNIASGSGAEVRAVFEGDITQIVFVQGLNNTVIIRHGNYLTTYSNLASVNVKTGDKVTLNQVIGRLSNSDDSDDCVLHFEIWKETENLNPEQWLRR